MLEKFIKLKELDTELLMMRTNQYPFVDGRELTEEDYENMLLIVDKKLLLLEDIQCSIDLLKAETSIEKRNINLKINK